MFHIHCLMSYWFDESAKFCKKCLVCKGVGMYNNKSANCLLYSMDFIMLKQLSFMITKCRIIYNDTTLSVFPAAPVSSATQQARDNLQMHLQQQLGQPTATLAPQPQLPVTTQPAPAPQQPAPVAQPQPQPVQQEMKIPVSCRHQQNLDLCSPYMCFAERALWPISLPKAPFTNMDNWD